MEQQYYRKARPRATIVGWMKAQLKKKNVVIAALVLIPAFSFVTFSNKGILKRWSLESEKQKMQIKIDEAMAEQRALQTQSKALDGDPRAIEKVAREQHGFVKEGETVYKVRAKK